MICTRLIALASLASVLAFCGISAGCDQTPLQPTVLTVTAIAPSGGGTGGGTRVTISGSGFRTGATVSFGGAAAVATVMSPTTIVADAPAHTAGTVDIVVTNSGSQQSSLRAAYTYAEEVTFTISGDITEMTEAGPVPVAEMLVAEPSTRTSTLTDENGSYTLAGIRAMSTAISTSKPGYVNETKPLTVSGDTRFDIRVARIGPFTLSGIVYEQTSDGRVPLEGVVLYCDSCGSPVGHTFVTTDSDGFYSLSWVLNGKTFLQFISKEGYRYAGPIEQLGIPVMINGSNTRFDIELVRR